MLVRLVLEAYYYRRVYHTSRALTATEARYSQIEREFLGLVFGLTRFSKLFFGIEFEVQNDHLPIVQLFKKPIDVLSNRLQRWMIMIQHHVFQIKHIKGSSNVLTDGLSRNSIKIDPSDEEITEDTVCFLMKSNPLNLKMLAEATDEDVELQDVVRLIQSGWTQKYSIHIRPYYLQRFELNLKICNDRFIICRGDQVIIPQSMKENVMNVAHEGHCGISKMKSNIRSHAYWIGMNSDIDDYVRKCTACTVYQTRCDPAPSTVVAENVDTVWEKISIDLTGPSQVLDNKVLLTIIDLHSRFPEIFILNRGTSHEIIQHLRSVFARFGLPKVIISDNGSVFTSSEFTDFLKCCVVTHSFASLYYPRGNSTIERLHGTLKNRLKGIRNGSRISLEAAIDQVLFDVRSSANYVNGETPFQRFFNRPMLTEVSMLNDKPISPVSRKRSVKQEYSSKYSRIRNYNLGQRILIRKGDGQPYIQEGKIVRKIRKYTYLVDLDGRHARYNQRNIKPLHGQGISRDFSADLAYDDVSQGKCLSLTNSHSTRRYPSRVRRPPQFFGDTVTSLLSDLYVLHVCIICIKKFSFEIQILDFPTVGKVLNIYEQ